MNLHEHILTMHLRTAMRRRWFVSIWQHAAIRTILCVRRCHWFIPNNSWWVWAHCNRRNRVVDSLWYDTLCCTHTNLECTINALSAAVHRIICSCDRYRILFIDYFKWNKDTIVLLVSCLMIDLKVVKMIIILSFLPIKDLLGDTLPDLHARCLNIVRTSIKMHENTVLSSPPSVNMPIWTWWNPNLNAEIMLKLIANRIKCIFCRYQLILA